MKKKRGRESSVDDLPHAKRVRRASFRQEERAFWQNAQERHDAAVAKLTEKVTTLLPPAIAMASERLVEWSQVIDAMRFTVECWDEIVELQAEIDAMRPKKK